MGTYLNPGNSGFQEIRSSRYVDKSGFISLINDTIGTKQKLTCISRPRRFGKSFAAQMLCAYYDRSCDSSYLFDDLAIAKDRQYQTYRNKYDVIYLDMTGVIGETFNTDMVAYIKRNIIRELAEQYPTLKVEEGFSSTLVNAVELTGTKFFMIIDEWDAPIREASDQPQIQREYLEFLRSLFKNSGTTSKIFAAAYMTGILPIKKDGSQSAISDFKEFTMLHPWKFSRYVGFTENEVQKLCEEYHGDFSLMKQWYDGYRLSKTTSIYNPNSVMEAIRYQAYRSYWTETSAAKSLMGYIGLDFDGLSKTIAELIGGIEVPVDANGFANDLVTFRNRDDVLTLLIHLGYLSYNQETGMVCIPNEEIRQEFAKAVREVKRDDTIRRVRESEQLILDTIHQNADAVAAQIQKIHEEETTTGKPKCRFATFGYQKSQLPSCDFFNNEQALRSVIKLAFFSYKDYYLKFEELPAGNGYADIVYLPKKSSPLPALVIELKWNTSAEGAIAQIKHKQYPDAIKNYGGDILLVGISYNKESKPGNRTHTCVIEKI